jgi:hypothetical protein
MTRCPSCYRLLSDAPSKLGARCPECHDPLYEAPGRVNVSVRAGDSACAVHSDRESLGPCDRCGNFYCIVCRTRWQGAIWCAECVSRLHDADSRTSAETRTHLHRVIWSLALGLVAWVLTLGSFVLIAVMVANTHGDPDPGVLVLVGMLVIFVLPGGVLTASVGTGMSLAALRTHGNHMILGAAGLIINGLYVGALIGIFALAFWLRLVQRAGV